MDVLTDWGILEGIRAMIVRQAIGLALLILGALILLSLGVADSSDGIKGNLDIHIVLPAMIFFLFVFSTGAILAVRIL